MEIHSVYAAICVAGAIPLIASTLTNRRPVYLPAQKGIGLPSRKGIGAGAAARIQQLFSSDPFRRIDVRRVDASELMRMAGSDPDLVIFRLIDFRLADGRLPETSAGQPPGIISVTTEELENTLPWIPFDSRVAVYQPGPVEPSLACRLLKILHGRKVLLLSGDSSAAVEPCNRIAGEPCN